MPKVLDFLWSEVNFGWFQCQAYCLLSARNISSNNLRWAFHVAEHAMTSSIYTNKPLGWPKSVNARDMTRWNIQGAFTIPKGRTLKTYLPFEVTNTVL